MNARSINVRNGSVCIKIHAFDRYFFLMLLVLFWGNFINLKFEYVWKRFSYHFFYRTSCTE